MTGIITRGDCIDVMASMPQESVDFILTDPPYLVNYRDRSGRCIAGDTASDWVQPAFRQMHRVLKNNAFAVSFYGWNRADVFMRAWKDAGFYIAGHIPFVKDYPSSTRYLKHTHEQAYLLAKGRPPLPDHPIADVIPWTTYTGNRLHPTQKPVTILKPLIAAFSEPGALVLDPFCGSGSTLEAARHLGRRFIGIELDRTHFRTAAQRMFLSRGEKLLRSSHVC